MGDTSKTAAPRAQESDRGPNQVTDYAQTCVKYVEKSIGVPLDFTVETLPILDHYLREARKAKSEHPETGALVATVAGCYLGEVIQKRHGLVWNLDAEDPLGWKLDRPEGSLTVFPVALAQVALDGPKTDPERKVFVLEPKLHTALATKLDDLPAVAEEDFVAPSTRVEVIDMAVDLLTGWSQARTAEGDDDGKEVTHD